VALFLAVGTSGAAAVALVDGEQVENGSLTGRDIHNRSLAVRDLARLPAPNVTVREGPEAYFDCMQGCPGMHSVTAQPASCHRGEVALGGGVSLPAEPGTAAVTASVPIYRETGSGRKPTGWSGSGWVEIEATESSSIPAPRAWVVCAKAQ
jgi:hypothetical protein